MAIPTEPIGSIPRPADLLERLEATDGTDPAHDALYDAAIRDTIARFEATGSPVITDGEQRKDRNFWTYGVHGLPSLALSPFSPDESRKLGIHTCPGGDRDSTHTADVETPEEVRGRVLEAAEFVPLEQLRTTDDRGFAPFCDDRSTSRDVAFAKIRSRVLGTKLAADELGILE